MNASDNNSQAGDTEGSSEEPGGELRWNEAEWVGFLKKNGAEQLRYLRFHYKFREHPERLDQCAKLMGWDTGEWVPAEEDSTIVPEGPEDPPAPTGPYCLHNHPVFIVTKALCGHLIRAWHYYCNKTDCGITPELAVAFCEAVRDTEFNIVMAMNAMDTREWSLGVSQMKLALVSVNNGFAAIDRIPEAPIPLRETLVGELRTCLHDLRELALRVMNDARFELSPDSRD